MESCATTKRIVLSTVMVLVEAVSADASTNYSLSAESRENIEKHYDRLTKEAKKGFGNIFV